MSRLPLPAAPIDPSDPTDPIQPTHLGISTPSGRADAWQLGVTCIANLLAWYQQHHPDLLTQLQPEREALQQLQAQLDQRLVRVAAFGLVSRGKSAVLNAIYGETVFPTGALNGVTQWPHSIRWAWPHPTQSLLQIELTDTPGLDEIAGAERGQMAQEVVAKADLILFISAGPLAEIEIEALQSLTLANKPLLWVLNKQDCYPDLQIEQIYQQYLGCQLNVNAQLSQRLSPAQMIPTAAAPAPKQVRHEWADGRSSYAWEPTPSQVEFLQARLTQFLQTEASLAATSQALLAAHRVEHHIFQRIYQERRSQIQQQTWRYSIGKLVAMMGLVALGNWGWGLGLAPLADLLLVRALQKSYGLPIHPWVAARLVQTLLVSSGGVVLSGLLLLILGWLSGTGEMGGGNLFLQVGVLAIAAGYGSYRITEDMPILLRQGIEFDAQRPAVCLQALWSQVQPGMLLHPLLPYLKAKLQAPPILQD